MFPPEPHALQLSIVMPCLNEAETLAACIAEARQALDQDGIAGEVVVADNGSTDGSIRIAETSGARVVAVLEKGYGAALRGGIAAALAPFVVYGDCDGSYDFSQCGRLLARLEQGADLVLGTRLPAGGGIIHPGAMPWLHRFLGTPVLTFMCRLLYGAPITDINSGMRGVRVAAFQQLNVLATGMEFASEIVLQMARRQMRIAEVPISLRKAGRSRPPHLRTWRDGWRHLCILLIYSPKALFIVPGATLAVLGTMTLALLLPGALTVGQISFSTNSRIVASLVALAGTEILLMGLLAKYLAHTQHVFEANERYVRGFERFSRLYAIPLGVTLLALGAVSVLFAIGLWSEAHFGAFDQARADRLLAPAAAVSVFGLQLIACAFFAMLLDMVRRR